MTKTNGRKIEIVHLTTSSLLSVLVLLSGCMLALLLWAGRAITDGQWPGDLKLRVCGALGISVIAFLVTYGRRALKRSRLPPGTQIGVTGVQALWVVLFVIAIGSFGTWLVWGPPFVPPWNGR